ncbi:MAG TPA: helix-turn-helix domain-containing protein [Thermoanaerobaculia bacterium]|nr:helix-turn-helix domain-containing protein [Thermoanaerobaculia bacterium]
MSSNPSSFSSEERSLERFFPSSSLRTWVSGYFRWSGLSPGLTLPNGQIDVIFDLERTTPSDDSLEIGMVSVHTSLLQPLLREEGSSEVDAFGLCLFPWTSPVLLSPDTGGSGGRAVVERVGPVEAVRLRRMISDCATDFDRVRLLDGILSRMLPEAGELESILYRLWVSTWESGGRVSPVETAKEEGWSEEYTYRMFQQLGLTVRSFVRLARFHAFLRLLPGGERISVLSTQTGYYDPAHLTRECREFSGLPPRRLHARIASGGGVFTRETDLWLVDRSS